MSANPQFTLTVTLSMFLTQLPVLIVCFTAAVVVLMKWKQGGAGSIWALLGFGLAVFLGVAIPVVQGAAQFWMHQGDNVAQRASILGALGFVWSFLRAATYALLLIAVFAGRSNSNVATTAQ